MAEHKILIASTDDTQAQLADLAICPVAKHLYDHGHTHRYTVSSEDLPKVIAACKKLNVTLQEIVMEAEGCEPLPGDEPGDLARRYVAMLAETYPVLHEGTAPPHQ